MNHFFNIAYFQSARRFAAQSRLLRVAATGCTWAVLAPSRRSPRGHRPGHRRGVCHCAAARRVLADGLMIYFPEHEYWFLARGDSGAALEPLWGEGDFVTENGPYRFVSGAFLAASLPPWLKASNVAYNFFAFGSPAAFFLLTVLFESTCNRGMSTCLPLLLFVAALSSMVILLLTAFRRRGPYAGCQPVPYQEGLQHHHHC
jgi:hypothetical protein